MKYAQSKRANTKNMRKTCCFLAVCLLIALLGACTSRTEKAHDKLRVVATLFPQYDFARRIAGDKAEVTLLLPPGTESHTFDPKPADIARIYDADIFAYTGARMEPWAQRVAQSANNSNLIVADLSAGIELISGDEHDDHDGMDPHIWLDPTLAMVMVDNLTAALCAKDAANAAFYEERASAYKAELKALDEDFADMVAHAKRHILVFGGRFAHQYFLNRYGLGHMAVFDSCSTQAEPGVRDVAEVIGYMKRENIPCIYYEELVDPVVARSIAEQTGASIALFSTAHNVSQRELDEGTTYIDIMRGNLARIQKGLN